MKSPLIAVIVTLLLTTAVHAVEAPPRKEGLWSVHKETTNQPGNKKEKDDYTICRNHAYDVEAQQLVTRTLKACKTNNEKVSGAVVTSELECAIGTTVIHTKGTNTMRGDTASHAESHTTYTPAMGGITSTDMIQEQKYVGTCPAGMKPGDKSQK